MKTELPIHSVLEPLCRALELSPNVVLQAPPGAGKSTVVPLALLSASWLDGRKIIMLEPRRLAARAVAERMAETLGEKCGETVGYRMRMQTRCSEKTRIEVITEGILTRLLQTDPELSDIGCIIFDEFHERNLQADLGLALTLDTQAAFREDLRLLIMSATLNTSAVAKLLNTDHIIESKGRQFPIQTFYRPASGPYPETSDVVNCINHALQHDSGSLLVFLPGVAEINRTLRALGNTIENKIDIFPLYGAMDLSAQTKAIEPTAAGRRKIVLTTDIAETSLTIDSISVVIDSGQKRSPRFDARSGFNRLNDVKNSRASADQRRGRAGRTGPGICYRLWPESEKRDQSTPAEIMQTDLSSFTLELAAWGVTDPEQLLWLDPPPASSFCYAQNLLQQLSALSTKGSITDAGKAINKLGLHPRLGTMILRAKDFSAGKISCDLAALLSERWPASRLGAEEDIAVRLRLLNSYNNKQMTTEKNWFRRVAQQSHLWQKKLPKQLDQKFDPAVLLAFAYPDRIAQSRHGKDRRYKLSNGKGAYFRQANSLSHAEYLVVSELDGAARESKIYSAIALDKSQITEYLGEFLKQSDLVAWDNDRQSVITERQVKLGELLIESSPLKNPSLERVQSELLIGIHHNGLDCLPWTKACRLWQTRIQFTHSILGEDCQLPDMSDEALLNNLEHWLLPWLHQHSSIKSLQNLPLEKMLHALLDWSQQQQLEQLAPTHYQVPSGSSLALHYQTKLQRVVLAVRFQEIFSCTETPTIADGRFALTVELLSPAGRVQQTTQDLKGFWSNSYPEIKKEMKGRYPRHHWPDDPAQTKPHRGIRPLT